MEIIYETVKSILTNVLTALYQPFWFAVLHSVMFMFFYLYAKERGWKESIKAWLQTFKTSSTFRRVFLLVFYTTMILFRTLLNRNMWLNPLSEVMGGWWIYEDGKLTTEPLENLMLFIPFTVLLLWAISSKEISRKFLENFSFNTVLWRSLKIVFIFSLTIEFLQLFLRLGSFQLSDLFYNTLGGGIGGIIYWIGYKLAYREDVKNIKRSIDN